MNKSSTQSEHGADCNSANTAMLRNWTGAWLVTTAAVAFGPKFIWDFSTLPTIIAVLVNLAVGLGMIMATRRYLKGLDEMQQKIFLDAGALTLGVGMVCGLSYEMLEDIKLISFEPEISHLVMLMALTFLAGMVFGHWKYR